MTAITAPIPYFGGKAMLAPTLCALLPPHAVYVEVFGGAASLLLAKPPADTEIYNDLDSGVVNFYRVLRDPLRSKRLRELLRNTPYAREEYAEALAGWRQCTDEVEMARQWFVLARSSFAAQTDRNAGWKLTTKPSSNNPARSFANAIEMLPGVTKRLRHVQIEHISFERLIPIYDGASTLLYCDPPYLPETRKPGAIYRHEMSASDHTRLLALLTAPGLQSMVILSGYRSGLYDAALDAAGWERLEKQQIISAVGRTRASGLQGRGSVSSQAKHRRVECIWLNPAAQHGNGQRSLFGAAAMGETR